MIVAFALLCSTLMHPFHVSLAEAEWNQESQRFEIAMRLDPRDLQLALAQHSGRRIVLETADADVVKARIMAYVNAKFRVVDDQERSATWHWVGLENETKYIWLYLELAPHASSRQLLLSNRMLQEVSDTQINTMLLLGTTEKQTLRFTKTHPNQSLVRNKAAWQTLSDDKAN